MASTINDKLIPRVVANGLREAEARKRGEVPKCQASESVAGIGGADDHRIIPQVDGTLRDGGLPSGALYLIIDTVEAVV